MNFYEKFSRRKKPNYTVAAAIVVLIAVILTAGFNYLNGDRNGNNENTTTAISSSGEPGSVTTSCESSGEPTDLYSPYSYDGTHAYVAVNDNKPYFEAKDLVTTSYESYSDLDTLGRCGVAISCIGVDLMPTEERGSIGSVKPSGWQTVKYDCVEGKYLYNRCHLIGYQLTAENANNKNLITGTRYLNIQGMLDFENMVADFLKENTSMHVLYRVTPIFEGNNLVASGVLMEAQSVEDNGEGIMFCIYAYNVQPGVTINYKTGESHLTTENETTTKAEETTTNEPTSETTKAEETTTKIEETTTKAEETTTKIEKTTTAEAKTYILNNNTNKFHLPTCGSAPSSTSKNYELYEGDREDLLNFGYTACGICKP